MKRYVLTESACMWIALSDNDIEIDIEKAKIIEERFMELMEIHGYIGNKKKGKKKKCKKKVKPQLDRVMGETYYMCPTCGHLILELNIVRSVMGPKIIKDINYCERCGARLEWGEDK